MRRKKLANKIMSILMSAMMLVSTPMSALATDVEIQQVLIRSKSRLLQKM